MKTPKQKEHLKKLSDIDLKIKEAKIKAKLFPFDKTYTWFIEFLEIQKRQILLNMKIAKEIERKVKK